MRNNETEILYDVRCDYVIGEEVTRGIDEALKKTLDMEHVDQDVQISVSVVGAEEIARLNNQYRGKNAVTDVLSFPMGDEDERGVYLLGDIVICLQKVLEQARAYENSFARELCYLSVHSLLHLLGYDHETEEDRSQMREKEESVMAELGLERQG